MTLDRAKLLVWLRDRGNHRNLLVAAVYLGLASRIANGEFDVEEGRS